jgi:hypothetical protein
MKYYALSQYLQSVDELIIKCKSYEKALRLRDYFEKKSKEEYNQRLIIDLTCYDAETPLPELVPILESLVTSFPAQDFTVKLDIYTQYSFSLLLKDKNIKFFFNRGVSSFDLLRDLIVQGVSDVYIVDSLGFWLKKVAQICHAEDNYVNVRVYPNIAQSGRIGYNAETAPKDFYIRPEDIKFYEDCVDVMELTAPIGKLDIMYKIYSSREWSGDLTDIIYGLEETISNKRILPEFGKARSLCEKRCNYGTCHVCDSAFILSTSLEKHELSVTVADSEIPLEEKAKWDRVRQESFDKYRQLISHLNEIIPKQEEEEKGKESE